MSRLLAWPTLGFALRTSAASLVALYLAFRLNLDDPKWAAMTVWIVAQGSRGASLSKSQYRIMGTLVGASVAVALTANFAQTPELFIPALGIWLGACTAVATGLRNFRAYGAVLAGYTAAIVAFDSVNAPRNVFDVATARVVYICLGIIAEAVFAALFAPGSPFSDVQARLSAFLRRTAEVCAGALRGQDDTAAVQRLYAQALELDVAAEYAAAASSSVRRRLGHFRTALVEALAQMAAAQSLRKHVSVHPGMDEAVLDDVSAFLDAVAEGHATDDAGVAHLRAEVEIALAEESRKADGSMPRLFMLDRLDTLLGAAHDARMSERRFADENAPPLNLKFGFHIDHAAALQNGLRSFVALVAGSAVWVLTAWSSGPGFVTILAVVCALFATRPNPVAAGVGFLKGAVAAVLAAALCHFALLPVVTDFVPLAGLIGLFLVGTGVAMRTVRLAPPAASFAFLFLDLLSLDNRGRADGAAFWNGAAALLLGVAAGLFVFSLLFPSNPPRRRDQLRRGLLGDLADVGQAPAGWTKERWLSKTADRLAQHAVTNGSVTRQQADLDLRRMLAALTIGNAAIALNELAKLDARLTRPLAAVRRRLASGDGIGLAKVARLAAGHLAHDIRRLEAPARQPLIRATMLLREISGTAPDTGPSPL
jgi:uncharacterized membrane protein YccC